MKFTEETTEFELTVEEVERQLLLECGGKIDGTDSNDALYSSISELWKVELSNTKEKQKSKKMKGEKSTTNGNDSRWYRKAYDFWEDPSNCPVSDDGVLQGYGVLTPLDSRDSNLFLDSLASQNPSLRFDRVADCGAGIGRVTKHLLLPRFGHVDLVEQSPRLTSAAPAYIGAESSRVTCINIGLQDFEPSPGTYDVIWIQWVIGHLADLDAVRFFRRCAAGLKPGGVVVLKDNTAGDSWVFVVDRSDSSVSRSLKYIKLLARLAGLQVCEERLQEGFPEELFPVYMLAFQPTATALHDGDA
mmetsp:Transcript_3993/g.5544  ORF Transcript_3993/g.5544 Transcript_3993/m.5544 type:complete len:302 (-) Transcript_3993:71-976(-)